MNSLYKRAACTAVMTLAASPALAHEAGVVSGFHAGVLHPVLGPDHLMAMIAVGVWSAARPEKPAWRGPALFVTMLGVGALIGVSGVPLPLVEPGILASVVVLGLIIAAARLLPAVVGLAAIGFFGLLHGHTHGTEAAGALGGYMAGFMFASMALHGIGYSAGRHFSRARFGLVASGFSIAAGGLVLAGS